ncbi:MAG: ABC transporter ATP-binding protein/permease [Rhodoferax sp.]|nr:MAG: ABC transporter ATP-binding protein/permease [Rhodoferax sp.]
MTWTNTIRQRLHATNVLRQQVWSLSAPYFRSEEKWKARAMLAAIVALNLALVYMAVLFNDWNRIFYDALQEKNKDVFWEQLWRFTYLAFGFIVIAVYKFYLTQLLEMRWRAWMTAHYLQRWLHDQTFYHLELLRFVQQPNAQGNPDNPDQRIAEDISQFTSLCLSLSMGLLNSVVTLASFVGILWSLSGNFGFTLGAQEFSIPGFMVWVALLYCLAGSVITHYVGRKQIGLNFEQQRREADFRHHMVRLREYSEAIALDRGEAVAHQQTSGRFAKVLDNYLSLIRAQKQLIWFTSFFGQAAVIFPFLVAAPRYFSGAIQLGELMQISSAFGQVQGALSWLVDNYPSVATWRAVTERLTSFEASFQALARTQADKLATKTEANSNHLEARDLHVQLPQGQALIAATALHAAPGDRVLLQGPSGSGKSSLFRTLAGIWPFAQGQLNLPADAMFIPQRPYFPNGPLREALAYPLPANTYTDAQLQQALDDALLPQLKSELDRMDAWGQKLSGGEQQRLAVARVLLKKPKWVFADEATSALDEAAESTIYQRLCDLVTAQGGALVSIAHRPSLARFHNQRWVLTPSAEASAQGALFTVSTNPA